MEDVSPRFLDAWRGSAERRRRVLLDNADGLGFVEVKHSSYRVNAARGERVVARYEGQITLPPGAPKVNTYGGQLRVQAGFVIDDGIEFCTLATVRVESRSESDAGDQNVTAYSVEHAVEVAGIEDPLVIGAGSGISAILQILAAVVPAIPVRVLTRRDAGAPGSVWETNQSPWDAVSYYADALSVEVHSDPYGNLVISDIPSLADAPVVVVDAAGVKTGHVRDETRSGVPSVVVVEGNRTNTDDQPPRGKWRDTNPLSPTYYLGPFGRQQKTVNSPVATTDKQCDFMAAAIGAQTQGLARTLKVTSVPMDFVVPGDVIQVTFLPTSDFTATPPPETHIVDEISHTSDDSPPKGQPLTTRMIGGGS